MKRKAVLLLCTMMFICGCSQNKATTEQNLEENTEVQDSSVNDTSTEINQTMVTIPFGYQFNNGYQELFQFQLPDSWSFSSGSSWQGEHVIYDKKSATELSAEATSLQLDYALFSAPEDFKGSVSISSYYNGNDFEATKEAWSGSLNSRMSEETLQESSGEYDGHQWSEMYWESGGNYEYHLLMDMNGEMAYVFDVSGAENSEMNDFEKLHIYFKDSINIK